MSTSVSDSQPLLLAARIVRAFNTLVDEVLPHCGDALLERHGQDLSGSCEEGIIQRLKDELGELKPDRSLGMRIDALLREGKPPREIVDELVEEVTRRVLTDSGSSECAAQVNKTARAAFTCYVSLTSANSRRCEALPAKIASFTSLAATYGLGIALNFYISKSNRGLYWALYHALTQIAQIEQGKEIPLAALGILAERLPHECREGGENVALALAVQGFEEMKIMRRHKGAGESTDGFKTMILLFDEIIEAESSGAFARHRRRALDYLTFLKRYIDGLYG